LGHTTKNPITQQYLQSSELHANITSFSRVSSDGVKLHTKDIIEGSGSLPLRESMDYLKNEIYTEEKSAEPGDGRHTADVMDPQVIKSISVAAQSSSSFGNTKFMRKRIQVQSPKGRIH